MKTTRILLATVGIGLIAVGAVGLTTDARPLPDLAVWLAGAVIAHDGVLAPTVLLAGAGLWWASARLPDPMRQVLVGGFAVAGMLSLLAWPLIHRQDVTVNPTALAQNYPANLALLLAITAVVTTISAGFAGRTTRGARHPESRRRRSTGRRPRRRPGRRSPR